MNIEMKRTIVSSRYTATTRTHSIKCQLVAAVFAAMMQVMLALALSTAYRQSLSGANGPRPAG